MPVSPAPLFVATSEETLHIPGSRRQSKFGYQIEEQDNVKLSVADFLPKREEPKPKVPLPTWDFWVVKVLCTTVGETLSEAISLEFPGGEDPNTSVESTTCGIMIGVSVFALCAQFYVKSYVPGIYWIAVILLSIVGTLITDNLTDNFGVHHWQTTIGFSAGLAFLFGAWYAVEKTLSIHSIYTVRRESFYWLVCVVAIIVVAAAYYAALKVFPKVDVIVPAFWIIFILTHPLGASLGELLSKSLDEGGLGLGAVSTSIVFLGVILVLVGLMHFKASKQQLGF
ncbi:UNVERIFIED_CONTAM: hypothetical protein HDU68_001480 [Siphonaria sp. JEL0065]|nr:hypothetical protein HDU68_001480 [Siphonaria sp. JEL0065]